MPINNAQVYTTNYHPLKELPSYENTTIVSCGFPSNKKVLIPAPIMRLFRLKSRFSKHRAAPRLVLWQAKQCFIRENCGGAVALVVELLRLALIDDHSSPRPKEAKNYKTQQVSLSAGVPRSYTTLQLPRPAELGSVRVMRKFAKTTF